MKIEQIKKQQPGARARPIGRDYPPIPLLEKIAYGVGVLPMNTSVNSIKKLSGPIFNITLGIASISRGQCAIGSSNLGCDYRIPLWDGFRTTQNRAGEGADPYLFLGAILTAIGYALILNVPQGLSQDALYAYFMIASLALYTCVTILQVSYNSLGLLN